MLLAISVMASTSSYGQSESTITIPAIHVPPRHVPGIHIPAIHIPAKKTSFGTIAGFDIPAIDIPAFDIPATDTTAETIQVPEYSRIYRSQIVSYTRTTHPTTVVSTTSENALTVESRNAAFTAHAAYATSEMLRLFASADVDQSGTLSWDEVEYFQQRLYRTYGYHTEAVALRPDQFVDRGEGDCKAWSLMTAAFCAYWGWDAYIACFFNNEIGHAICFVRSPYPVPAGFVSWRISGRKTVEGDVILPGEYVPVDYDHVGSFSNALSAGMTLDYFLTPAKTYGERW
jgi:hypothetical protein